MRDIVPDHINGSWYHLVNHLIHYGTKEIVRGQLTYEDLGVQFITSIKTPLVSVALRRLGYKFAFGEANWIVSGSNKVDYVAKYSSRMKAFSDDGITLFGAYGPKFDEQVIGVVNALVKDTSTRQAVVGIWRENPPKTLDTPCTLSWQFLIRNHALHVISTMRSSDVWLGLPYDVFSVSQAATVVAIRYFYQTGVRLRPGNIIVQAGSSHLYEGDRKTVETKGELLGDLLNCEFYGTNINDEPSLAVPDFSFEPFMLDNTDGEELLKRHSLWLHLVAEGLYNEAYAINPWMVPEIEAAYRARGVKS